MNLYTDAYDLILKMLLQFRRPPNTRDRAQAKFYGVLLENVPIT